MKKITLSILMLLIISSTMLFASGNNETKEADMENKEESTMAIYHEIEAPSVKQMLDDKEEFYFIDVRTPEEYEFSHIPGAVNIPLDVISSKAAESFDSKDAMIVVYCRSGARSRVASKELVSLGYTKVYDLGGIISWPYEVTK